MHGKGNGKPYDPNIWNSENIPEKIVKNKISLPPEPPSVPTKKTRYIVIIAVISAILALGAVYWIISSQNHDVSKQVSDVVNSDTFESVVSQIS